MNRLVILIFLMSLLACQENGSLIESTEVDNLTHEQIDSVLTVFKFEYEHPIVLDSSDYVLIPISTDLLERRKTYSKDGYYADDFPRYWNVLFYNRISGESRLLTKNKLRISNIHAGKKYLDYGDSENKLLKGKILYIVGDIDYNKDDKLDGKDPEFLFISYTDGSNLLRLSPPNEDLIYYEVMPNVNQIIMNTRRDTNLDALFNEEDELIWHKTTLSNDEWRIEEIIDATQRQMIEHLYFEQWLKRK